LISSESDNSTVMISSRAGSFRADDKTQDGTYIPYLENEKINDRIYYHGEIGFHTYCAENGSTPPGLDNYNGIPLNNADLNSDNVVSVLESYEWLKNLRFNE
jgi:hypothetical protein